MLCPSPSARAAPHCFQVLAADRDARVGQRDFVRAIAVLVGEDFVEEDGVDEHTALGQRIAPGFELEYALADGRLADPGRPRDQAHAPVAKQSSLGRQRQPLLTLIQMREQDLEPSCQLAAHSVGYSHTTSTRSFLRSNVLFFDGFICCEQFPARGQDWDKIAKGLKPVCTAPNQCAATERFSEFQEAWGKKYPAVIRLRENAWAEFVPFLSFDVEIRKVVCSTNAIESVNARIRKAVRARGHFPYEAAAMKCVYMALMSLDPTGKGRKRWTMRWKAPLNAFQIAFEGRLRPSTDPYKNWISRLLDTPSTVLCCGWEIAVFPSNRWFNGLPE
ncbi:hypothetical protein M2271_004263 [Streptomyces sp. LBL]|nr:hypothetical protein [Streptomyces sp. LBL]